MTSTSLITQRLIAWNDGDMAALEELMQGRTTFIIAHRLSTIRRASQILVVNRGTIAEYGTHESLIARDGIYAMLYRNQMEITRHDPISVMATVGD